MNCIQKGVSHLGIVLCITGEFRQLCEKSFESGPTVESKSQDDHWAWALFSPAGETSFLRHLQRLGDVKEEYWRTIL